MRSLLAEKMPEATFHWVEETGSTNADLVRLAQSGAKPWTVLLADRQTGGRGRHDRVWVSPTGGLYLSILLVEQEADSPITLIPLVVGLALHTALGKLAQENGIELDTHLKWPNDLVTPRGKLAGILCESTITESGWQIIAGIGVNLETLPEMQVQNLDQAVTSLRSESGGQVLAREPLVLTLLLELRDRLDQWRRDPASLRREWESAAGVGRATVTVRGSGTPKTGIMLGISDTGALRLRTSDGDIEIHAAEGIEEHS